MEYCAVKGVLIFISKRLTNIHPLIVFSPVLRAVEEKGCSAEIVGSVMYYSPWKHLLYVVWDN
jgi:hypothetical protein